MTAQNLQHVRPWRTIQRRLTRKIRVGSVEVGGDAPITVQSMTKTLTSDAAATIAQIRELEEAGADIVRVSCPPGQSLPAHDPGDGSGARTSREPATWPAPHTDARSCSRRKIPLRPAAAQKSDARCGAASCERSCRPPGPYQSRPYRGQASSKLAARAADSPAGPKTGASSRSCCDERQIASRLPDGSARPPSPRVVSRHRVPL